MKKTYYGNHRTGEWSRTLMSLPTYFDVSDSPTFFKIFSPVIFVGRPNCGPTGYSL